MSSTGQNAESVRQALAIAKRGVDELLVEEDFVRKLERHEATGEPLRATVALMELTPLAALRNGEAWELRSDGTTRRGVPLTIRGYPLQHGLAMPNGAEATYQLDPQWRRFVAIAGLAAGGQRAGPFEILIDGQQHYISSDPAVLKHNTPGLQVNVPIPLGSRTITLKVGGRSGIGAWGEAGFRVD